MSETKPTIADAVFHAVIDCPHEIDRESVILKFDQKAKGHNALNQLSFRIQDTLSSAAVAEREPVARQWLHRHSFTGAPMWMDVPIWMGKKSEVERPLYLDPPPTSELEAEIERLKARLAEAMKALDVVFEDTQARTKAGMTYGINGHPTLSIGTLHVVAQARFAARRVREGGKVDG